MSLSCAGDCIPVGISLKIAITTAAQANKLLLQVLISVKTEEHIQERKIGVVTVLLQNVFCFVLLDRSIEAEWN